MQLHTSETGGFQPDLRGIFWDIALNTAVPVLLYWAAKRFFSASEFTALVVATVFPIGESVVDLTRDRRLDPIAVLVLLGIAVDAVAIFFGGSPKLLLVRESAFTGGLGLACFVSLLFPRPLMFYFGRHFMAGDSLAKRTRYDLSWKLAEVRYSTRLITAVWGVLLTGELCLRVVLVFTLTPELVLVISPLMLGALTVGGLVWTFRYAGRVRDRNLGLIEPGQLPG